jgi:hypothetical protein
MKIPLGARVRYWAWRASAARSSGVSDLHTVLQQVQAHYSVFEIIGKHFLDMGVTSRLV